MPRVWQAHRLDIEEAALKHKVPVELIVATICAETSGRTDAIRIEPGYVSDLTTPHRVSCGLMQTLISTARQATGNSALSRDDSPTLLHRSTPAPRTSASSAPSPGGPTAQLAVHTTRAAST